jgi:hypothetical protein
MAGKKQYKRSPGAKTLNPEKTDNSNLITNIVVTPSVKKQETPDERRRVLARRFARDPFLV